MRGASNVMRRAIESLGGDKMAKATAFPNLGARRNRAAHVSVSSEKLVEDYERTRSTFTDLTVPIDRQAVPVIADILARRFGASHVQVAR